MPNFSSGCVPQGQTVKIIRQTPALGAEVLDANIAAVLEAPHDHPDRALLKQAFIDHHILFIRDQLLAPEHLVQFAGLFGEVGRYPFAEPLPGYPEVIAIIKEPEQRTVFGGIWHTDSPYMPSPSIASVLYAVEVPPLGGDTIFSSQHVAFDTLDQGKQARLSGLQAWHSSAKNRATLREDHLQGGAMKGDTDPVHQACHPVIRTHPDTGRQSLYLSPAHTTHIEGLPATDSDTLLQTLFDHALKDDFKCRFRWREGTLAIWDNRCTLHYPVNDYCGHRRVMHRVTIEGDPPR